MTRTSIVAVAVLTFSSGLAAQAPVDFSGRWTIDAARSAGLPATQSRDLLLVVKQTPAQLVIERTTAGKTTTTTYALGGTESVRTGDDGTVVKRRSMWRDGALVTEIAETRSLLGVTVVVPATETCRIAADGALVIEASMKGGGREVSRKSVFTRAGR